MASKIVCISLGPVAVEQLDLLAKRRGVNKSRLIRHLIYEAYKEQLASDHERSGTRSMDRANDNFEDILGDVQMPEVGETPEEDTLTT